MGYLEFSHEKIEVKAKPNELIEGSFIIHATDRYAEGEIYSSDTRMRLAASQFRGQEAEIGYFFDISNVAAGNTVKGELVIISNYGEYTIPYNIIVQKSLLQCSLGEVRNLFHFTNLAKADWAEAVELFYMPEFAAVLNKHDKNMRLSYAGLSRNEGNSQNVEEFLIEANKKTPVIYSFSIESLALEDIQLNTWRSIKITREGWGYTYLRVRAEGDFIKLPYEIIDNDSFNENICDFKIEIDATRLHKGLNNGCVVFADASRDYVIPIDIMMERASERHDREKQKEQLLLKLTRYYIDMRYNKYPREQLVDKITHEMEILKELDEDNPLTGLLQVQLLIDKERFNEAKWLLDNVRQQAYSAGAESVEYCYYLYLTTLYNRDDDYIQEVLGVIENAYANNPTQWKLAWFMIDLDESFSRRGDYKWQFIEELFKAGCSSPVIMCEAVLLLYENPTFLLKLDAFEENVLWHAAKYGVLTSNLIEQLQYLAARKKEYSPLLYRILCEAYDVGQSPQTVAEICRQLILGDKKGTEFFGWYALGVEYSVRVTKLYEYYMMSIEFDKYGEIMDKNIEIPRMVLMYFAYQSTLDYGLNAFLYAYVVKNADKYPDLEQSYHIAIERFVLDSIKAGRINENIAYLYQNVITPRMVSDDTAYALTPLLFMHRIYVDSPRVKNVVIIHEKLNGESAYPITDNVCMLPIYGNEYKLFLQDEEGNRFTKSIAYENEQLMQPDIFVSNVSGYMKGRLSFDIYLCELEKNYITITEDNFRRFKSLAESEQVVEDFKKEIRTKLMRFYYDNDRIGELDAFLEDIEAGGMETQERAEVIRYLVSRGMFDKAYAWLRLYGISGVNIKVLARLISRRIVMKPDEYEEFLVAVSYHVYKNMRYDENILCYLMKHYVGRVSELKDLWRVALELELDTRDIMYRILKQIRYTGANLQEKDEILLAYAECEGCDTELVNALLKSAAYDYFVYDAIVDAGIFDKLYEAYISGAVADMTYKLAILKYAAENEQYLSRLEPQALKAIVGELLRADKFFPFYARLADTVPSLHYFKSCFFVEYKGAPKGKVHIHYAYDDFYNENSDPRGGEKKEQGAESYEIQEMREMYDGIYVSMFRLFSGEALQYYITESYSEDGEPPSEHITQSDTLFGDAQSGGASYSRFNVLNDIMVSISLQDSVTAEKLTEEYLYQDFCARELFKVLS